MLGGVLVLPCSETASASPQSSVVIALMSPVHHGHDHSPADARQASHCKLDAGLLKTETLLAQSRECSEAYGQDAYSAAVGLSAEVEHRPPII